MVSAADILIGMSVGNNIRTALAAEHQKNFTGLKARELTVQEFWQRAGKFTVQEHFKHLEYAERVTSPFDTFNRFQTHAGAEPGDTLGQRPGSIFNPPNYSSAANQIRTQFFTSDQSATSGLKMKVSDFKDWPSEQRPSRKKINKLVEQFNG